VPRTLNTMRRTDRLVQDALTCLLVLAIISKLPCEGALLRVGNPLQWQASKPFLSPVRASGISQFISHYKRCQGVEMDNFMWGDEVEYGIFSSDSVSGRLDLSCPTGYNVQQRLTQEVSQKRDPGAIAATEDSEWHPEYGSWMVEAVPGKPFDSNTLYDVLHVQRSMRSRRLTLHKACTDLIVLSNARGIRISAHTSSGHKHSERLCESDLTVEPDLGLRDKPTSAVRHTHAEHSATARKQGGYTYTYRPPPR
jgi:hypothetical protein